MPWKETDSMKERVKFGLQWEKRWGAGEGRINFAELCREFGISRQVGYVWLRRYRQARLDVSAWCVDFKGHFRTQDGSKCYSLTIIDAHSRLLIRCEVIDTPDGREVERIFNSAFSEFGLPATIRSDNGPPFAMSAPTKRSGSGLPPQRLCLVAPSNAFHQHRAGSRGCRAPL
jgi:transposase InsO family protein